VGGRTVVQPIRTSPSFGAVEAPAGSADVEAVGDQVPGRALDDPGGDGPAGLECLVVAQELVLGAQVADAHIGAPPLCGTQLGPISFVLDRVGSFEGVAVQDGQRMSGDPVLGGSVARLVEAQARRPQVLEDVDYVDDDVHVDLVDAGFGLDQGELVLGAVDQDHPASAVLRIAGLGVIEDAPDGVLCVVFDRTAQPLAAGDRSGPRNVVAAASARRGDHVVRPAPGRFAVVDRAERGHPLSGGLLPGGEAGAEGVLPLDCGLPGGFP
jgi:hypothetical protein